MRFVGGHDDHLALGESDGGGGNSDLRLAIKNVNHGVEGRRVFT